ncbi:MAG: CBS domain-containing protein [Elusimicrobia bacterium]|nr:CBS domain-containing protein [Elusimicrobiota bacterium]MDE2312907.1 CBS domain-containing protein [Elusimicrobiota bacterium]
MIRAKDVMSRRVVAARPEMTVGQVADLLVRRRISGVPVVDKKRRPVGVISLTDLVRRSRAPEKEKIPAFYREDGRVVVAPAVQSESEVPAGQVMTPAVLSADEKTPVAKLARFMLRWRIHRVMITAKGRLAGIITSFDLLRVVAGRVR